MVPARVDSNKKQAKSSISRVEEELFCIDTMARTVSGPSQATVHLARKTPQELYYECLDDRGGTHKKCDFQIVSKFILSCPTCLASIQ